MAGYSLPPFAVTAPSSSDLHWLQLAVLCEPGASGAAVDEMLTRVVAYLPAPTMQLPLATMLSACVMKITVLRGIGYGGQQSAQVF